MHAGYSLWSCDIFCQFVLTCQKSTLKNSKNFNRGWLWGNFVCCSHLFAVVNTQIWITVIYHTAFASSRNLFNYSKHIFSLALVHCDWHHHLSLVYIQSSHVSVLKALCEYGLPPIYRYITDMPAGNFPTIFWSSGVVFGISDK